MTKCLPRNDSADRDLEADLIAQKFSRKSLFITPHSER